MRVQKATTDSVLEVMYLLQHCIEDFNNNSVYQWNIAYPDYNRLMNEVEKGSLFIIKHKGVCIGTITLSEEQDMVFESVSWKNNSEKFIVINRIAVFPSWQNMGVGKKLIQFAEEYAKDNNFKSIRLDVASSSESLLKFYQSIGYIYTGDIHYPKQKEPFKCLEKIV